MTQPPSPAALEAAGVAALTQLAALADAATRTLNINVVVSGSLTITVVTEPPVVPPSVAVSARLVLSSGDNMAGQITVDTTDESATLQFLDDKGDTDAAQPDGSVVSFASDNETVATVAVDATNPLKADITPVGEGTANVSANIADADGNPIFEPDGVTPFSVDPVTVTVVAGDAVGAAFKLAE